MLVELTNADICSLAELVGIETDDEDEGENDEELLADATPAFGFVLVASIELEADCGINKGMNSFIMGAFS